MQKKAKKKGFTLIELIVVIAVLGILATVIVPRITGFAGQAKESATELNARELYNAISMGVANGDINPTATITGADEFTDVDGLSKYIDEWPMDTTVATPAVLKANITVASGVVTDITVFKNDGTSKLAGK